MPARVSHARGVQLRIRVALNRHKYIMLAAPACTGGWETRSIGISLWVEVGLPGMGRGVNWFPSVHIHTNKHSQCVPTRTHCVCVCTLLLHFLFANQANTHTQSIEQSRSKALKLQFFISESALVDGCVWGKGSGKGIWKGEWSGG